MLFLKKKKKNYIMTLIVSSSRQNKRQTKRTWVDRPRSRSSSALHFLSPSNNEGSALRKIQTALFQCDALFFNCKMNQNQTYLRCTGITKEAHKLLVPWRSLRAHVTRYQYAILFPILSNTLFYNVVCGDGTSDLFVSDAAIDLQLPSRRIRVQDCK